MNPLSATPDPHNDILRTKLLPPRLHSNTILREALLARLDANPTRKVTFIVAPAGFGKTTLVNQWLRGNDPPRAVAWVALDEDDSDAERFWRYVIAAYQTLNPAIGQAAGARLDAPLPMPFAPPPIQSAVALLLNDLAAHLHPSVLVLDDYHAVTDETIHSTLTFLLEQLPDPCHVVVIARHAPPLSLARLRAHGDLTDLHADLLRFSLPETEQFLAQTMSVPIEQEIVRRLWERTEGWAVGLRLATLAWQSSTNPAAMTDWLEQFSGSQTEVVEYLVGDVLQKQPPDVQQFLLQTSLLETLNGSLCDTVTGRNDSAILLNALAGRNFFLHPLEGDAGWYRYHALFAEAMRHEAARRWDDAGLYPFFHRASHWYEEQGMQEEAIESALDAGEWNRAVALIEPLVEGQHLNDPNDPHRIRAWLEQLPDGLLQQRPLLCFSFAIVLLRTLGPRHPDALKRGTAFVQYAEAGWRREGNHARLGEVYAVQMLHAMWSGDMEGASRWAKESIARLPVTDTVWRGLCLGFVGRSELRAGKLHDARRTLMEAKAGSEAINNNYATRAHMMMLAAVSLAQGELTFAEALYRQALPSAESDGDLSDQAPAHLGFARLAYERNEMPLAHRDAEIALATATQIHAFQWHVSAELLLAQIELVQQQHNTARERFARLLVQLSPQRNAELYREILAAQAMFNLRTGDLDAVRHWAETVHEVEAPLTHSAFEHETLLMVRLRLAEGDVDTALRLMEGMAARADTDGRIRTALEIRLLTALAHFALSERDAATLLMRDLLQRTHSMGVHRFFLDEGTPCAELIRATVPLLTEGSARSYAQALLQEFVVAHHETGNTPLLSPQEQRVLEWLAAGQSYQEIAQSQIVSVNTIKTQLRHIYRKLGATSRQEALEIARQLHLLP